MPKVATAFSIKAIFTVNSPLRDRNSLVPSRGSTRKKLVKIEEFALRQRAFLGNYRNPGGELRKASENNALGGKIRLSDGR